MPVLHLSHLRFEVLASLPVPSACLWLRGSGLTCDVLLVSPWEQHRSKYMTQSITAPHGHALLMSLLPLNVSTQEHPVPTGCSG